MGSLGYILGGAMQGIGGALATQTQEQMRDRREIALENLRQQNRREEIVLQGDIQDRNASRGDDRADRNDSRSVARRTTATMTTDTHRAGITERENDQKFQQQVTLTQIEHRNSQSREQLSSTLRRGDAAYERSLTAGDVVDTMEGSDGFYWFRTRDGQTRRSQVPVAPRSSSGGSTVLDEARGTTAPAAPARPAAPATTTRPATPAQPPAARPAPAAAPAATAARPTPAPAARPQAQAPVAAARPAPPARPTTVNVFRARNDAEAERFMNNPLNRGKYFYGPDGQTYQVP